MAMGYEFLRDEDILPRAAGNTKRTQIPFPDNEDEITF
jgi:hypothetical protein